MKDDDVTPFALNVRVRLRTDWTKRGRIVEFIGGGKVLGVRWEGETEIDLLTPPRDLETIAG